MSASAISATSALSSLYMVAHRALSSAQLHQDSDLLWLTPHSQATKFLNPKLDQDCDKSDYPAFLQTLQMDILVVEVSAQNQG